ncbi:MAG TPA: hypothetical protein VER03_12255 [Bryobacteraceae bacterium]|nr:hypothetical protein [Bryobacteraceae bacterium]
MRFQRRTLLQITPLALAHAQTPQTETTPNVPATFPSHPPELAREMVGVSHGNEARVRELLKAQPDLAKASWDWGFGDWETALGAASHVGNRPIANLLIDHGAPPTLFSATMLGQLDVVKALIAASPGVQRLAGPHSISLLNHAKAGGAQAKSVLDYLIQLGDADGPATQPLTEEALASILGTYSFGPADNDRIDITVVKGQPMFRRAGAEARRLFHLGDLTFHPAGAAPVRISFSPAGLLTIRNTFATVTAKRVSNATSR